MHTDTRMNHTCLCLLSQSWHSFTDPGMDGRLSWPGQPEWWINSRPRTATWRLSRLSTIQTVTPLTGQVRVSSLPTAAARSAPAPSQTRRLWSHMQWWSGSTSDNTSNCYRKFKAYHIIFPLWKNSYIYVSQTHSGSFAVAFPRYSRMKSPCKNTFEAKMPLPVSKLS